MTRVFFDELNQVHNTFSSNVTKKPLKLPKNLTAPNILSAIDMAIKLFRCYIIMRVFQNNSNERHSICCLENIA